MTINVRVRDGARVEYTAEVVRAALKYREPGEVINIDVHPEGEIALVKKKDVAVPEDA